MCVYDSLTFVFFQAEDGIRDIGVTGVQTCALPIFHLLKVAELDHITDDAVAITFEVPEHLREEFRFVAGQHVSLRCTIAGDDVRRNYSICVPATSGKLRVGVKRLPGGVFSSYAMDRLRVGDTLEVRSEEHTSELQSRQYLVCRLLLEKKKTTTD